MKTLTEGQAAPKFELLNQAQQTIKLTDLIKTHKVLVYFYPKALTPGCTTQACGLRDTIAELEAQNTKVVGISPDQPEKLAKFVDKHDLNFDLLADPDHAVADGFGVWGLKKFMGKEYDGIHRISFLVGKDGNVEHVFNKFKTKDHHQVVLDYLTSSQDRE
ncbi:thioredoxin-dependent thiol peroxidase [Catenovulum adriaticum]|uniref:thioredoxin-dependent peroxiredoxin n=1 Tax=Catenovulum adriaticum TaxID=2984846 RepID=A0ABY7AIP9_9ALTE|nr:thioredoxin-dependent thiol peroxidase [Catenovulum sp. TS8]WAJ69487.1 thioredoxin-dependent thiol peroxidase [Catenovulum sp. TS8]